MNLGDRHIEAHCKTLSVFVSIRKFCNKKLNIFLNVQYHERLRKVEEPRKGLDERRQKKHDN